MHGPLAQSVEQKTFNLLVDGSNPSRPTNAFKEKTPLGVSFFAPQSALSALGRSAPCASLVVDPAVAAYPHDQLSIQRGLVGLPHD